MEARIFLGLAIGLLAVSSVVGFRDNGVQHKWSPYKPRLEYAELYFSLNYKHIDLCHILESVVKYSIANSIHKF